MTEAVKSLQQAWLVKNTHGLHQGKAHLERAETEIPGPSPPSAGSKSLGPIDPNPSIIGCLVYLFSAEQLRSVGSDQGGAGAYGKAMVPAQEAMEMDGKVTPGPNCVLLLKDLGIAR